VTTVFLDLETYSATPITVGTYNYAADAEITVAAWAIDDGPVIVRDMTIPEVQKETVADLGGIILSDTTLVIHNSQFDRVVLDTNGTHLPAAQIHDTMVMALAHGLPGSLGQLCEIYRLPMDVAKDKRGKALIQLFCRPRPATANIERATRDTHPQEWQDFLEYARLDIESMRELYRLLPRWNYPDLPFEYRTWCLDQRINDRGVAIDLDLARAAVRAVDTEQKRLADATSRISGGALESTNQRDATLAHMLVVYGVELPDLTASTLERRINDPDLPEPVKELMRLRLQSSTSSTAKYKTLLAATSKDGRLRGCLQFDGASRTGRWAGRLFQPQNLPSRGLLPQEEIVAGIEALKGGFENLYTDNVMRLASSCLRSVVVAPEGKELAVSDLSNIEGRDAAWLAGEEWKLDAFRDFDKGTGPDLYKLAYAKSFNVHHSQVTKAQRQIGKVQELALQYQGGVGAFVTFALAYGIDLDQMAAEAKPHIPKRIWDDAAGMFDWAKREKRDVHGLKAETFIACDSLKRLWREAHPAISSFWPELEAAAMNAINNPGNWYGCRKLAFRRDGGWLRMRLPSGRCVCYAGPKIEDGKLSYLGVNQYTRRWGRLYTYGGKLFENACQAVARDVMAHNMHLIEDAGFDLLLTVHDEVITEAPKNLNIPAAFKDEEEPLAAYLSSLLASNPAWAPDMPLASAGFQASRYRKD
jgi:DNA polymerase